MIARAEGADVLRVDGSGEVRGVRLERAGTELTAETRRDVEAFARDLAGGTRGHGLGGA